VYSPQDGTFGVGTPIDDWSFDYKGCLFRYYDEPGARHLVHGWEDVALDVATWVDPPHGTFRPVPHVHHSFVVRAQKPRTEK
jgi:hypothetical protein